MPVVIDGFIAVSLISAAFGIFMLAALYIWACMHFGNDL